MQILENFRYLYHLHLLKARQRKLIPHSHLVLLKAIFSSSVYTLLIFLMHVLSDIKMLISSGENRKYNQQKADKGNPSSLYYK